MGQMPRPMPPHLYRERNRHGTVVFYVRRGKGPRIRVKGEFGSAQFAANYRDAILGQEPQSGPVADSGTLGWLIARYEDSSAWERLSAATKRERAYTYKAIVGRAGDAVLAEITPKTIQQGVEDRVKTPFAANNFLKAVRSLFQWAKNAQHIAIDPTQGVKGFPSKTKGIHCWTEEEITRFEDFWPVGSRERLALAILLYTGLRRGDAAVLGRQHIRGGVITLRTEKLSMQVTIPILPELAKIINASPTGDLAFIATKGGRPMTKAGFGIWFREACKVAGVPGSAHGLRKAGATRAVHNGATVAQLNAIYGWTGDAMASLYTQTMDRARLARGAMDKLRKNNE